mmetsp:Transcript_25448/g.51756  ORF Transcript_25448/g.51756 Transcript_25448/m.51756 type:complete len:84 (-) Transcript_25448:96-347(-)
MMCASKVTFIAEEVDEVETGFPNLMNKAGEVKVENQMENQKTSCSLVRENQMRTAEELLIGHFFREKVVYWERNRWSQQKKAV